MKKNENRETAPGAPIAWEKASQPEEVQPGYGYVADNNESEETFYYHSDHLGSTSYVTDDSARITQYTAYLPYGELLVDEHSSSEDMPYKFNGKELDEETGLYYYGARYMQPVASIWYGIDPLTEKYPDVSAYTYCMGNPVKLVDVDGEDWYLHDGQYVWQNSTNKTYKDSKGTIWKNVGHTYTDKKTGKYYSLFGQIYDKNYKELQAVKNIDNAVMEYAEYYAIYKEPANRSPLDSETILPAKYNFGIGYKFIQDDSELRMNEPNTHKLIYGEDFNNTEDKNKPYKNTTYYIYNNSENNWASCQYMMQHYRLSSFGLNSKEGDGICFRNDNGFHVVYMFFSKSAFYKNKEFYTKLVKFYKNTVK